MRRAFQRDCLLKSRATLALVQFATFLWCSFTYDFSSCFFPKFKKSTKRGFPRGMTYFFGFYGPKIGEGGPPTRICPKISKTLKFGLFWGIFACSGLVLQNSAAHQCTCL